MAWCLLGLARCALANSPPEPEAVAHLLGTLRDPKRAAVLDSDERLKASVGHLALAIAPTGSEGSPLGRARQLFTQGDTQEALDVALKIVRYADDADEKEEARALVLTFIDALGAGPEATRARKRLANALF